MENYEGPYPASILVDIFLIQNDYIWINITFHQQKSWSLTLKLILVNQLFITIEKNKKLIT